MSVFRIVTTTGGGGTTSYTYTFTANTYDTTGQPLGGVSVSIYETSATSPTGSRYAESILIGSGTTNSSGVYSTTYTYSSSYSGWTFTYTAYATYNGVTKTANASITVP